MHMYIAPAHPRSHSFTSALSFSLSTHLFSSYFKLHPEVMALGQVDLNYRLTRNCWKSTCLARSRGSFTVFCGAKHSFEPGAASSDDVTVVVGALLGVSAARQDFHICSQVALTSISWKLQCEMYVLQFYSSLFSVVLAPLRLTLRCRCVDASTSTPPHHCTFTSSHAHIRRSTSPPHHTHTSAHLYHLCTSTLSLLHICPVFLSLYLFSRLCTFTSSHAHIHRSTSPPPYIYTSISHLRIHTVTPSRPASLSLFLYIFSTVLDNDNHMFRSRANRRLVLFF